MQRMTIAPMANYISRVKTLSNETLSFHTHKKQDKTQITIYLHRRIMLPCPACRSLPELLIELYRKTENSIFDFFS